MYHGLIEWCILLRDKAWVQMSPMQCIAQTISFSPEICFSYVTLQAPVTGSRRRSLRLRMRCRCGTTGHGTTPGESADVTTAHNVHSSRSRRLLAAMNLAVFTASSSSSSSSMIIMQACMSSHSRRASTCIERWTINTYQTRLYSEEWVIHKFDYRCRSIIHSLCLSPVYPQHRTHLPPSLLASRYRRCMFVTLLDIFRITREISTSLSCMQWLRMNMQIKRTIQYVNIIERKFLDNVGEPSYFQMPLTDCLYHVSFRRYSPLSLEPWHQYTVYGPQCCLIRGRQKTHNVYHIKLLHNIIAA